MLIMYSIMEGVMIKWPYNSYSLSAMAIGKNDWLYCLLLLH